MSFLVKKTCFSVKKFGKVWKKFGKSLEILEIWKFQTFRKLQKNDVQLEIRKLRKTCSDLKTDSKVRLKVQNAGPYIKDINRIVQWRNKSIDHNQ